MSPADAEQNADTCEVMMLRPRSSDPDHEDRSAFDTPALATYERQWTAAECASLRHQSGLSITVAVPARDEEATIAAVCRTIRSTLMDAHHVVDELLVLDGGSTDQTARRARAAGAHVVDVATVLPDLPTHPGKGESLWRSLAVVDTDIVVWVDADIRNFDSHFVTNLVAPLLTEPEIDFVKAFYTRPLQLADTLAPSGGGRVTELLAKPLLSALFPELAAFRQPLSGEYSARTEVMRDLPFFTGYSVELGLLIDLLSRGGLSCMAQADLGTRVHRNRPLEQLAPMAHQLAETVLRRAVQHGRVACEDPVWEGAEGRPKSELERPAMSLISNDWPRGGAEVLDAALG